jgi:hypothetical protein
LKSANPAGVLTSVDVKQAESHQHHMAEQTKKQPAQKIPTQVGIEKSGK